MGAKTGTDISMPTRKSARRSTPTPCNNKINGRFKNSNSNLNPRTVVALNEDGSNLVTRKLDALKSLLPTQNGDDVNADQLFKETADYILLLRTQVSILQKLVEFYGEAANSA